MIGRLSKQVSLQFGQMLATNVADVFVLTTNVADTFMLSATFVGKCKQAKTCKSTPTHQHLVFLLVVCPSNSVKASE